METQYKVKVEPYKKHFKSDRIIEFGGKKYLLTIVDLNTNTPEMFKGMKKLASKLLENRIVDEEKKFTITIEQ